MKKKRLMLLTLAAVLLALWFWRYSETQQYYDEEEMISYAYYTMGEFVPVEDDLIQLSEPADGYFVRVDSFRIVDAAEYADELGVSLEDYTYGIENAPDKLALVALTLRCDGSESQGIVLSDFGLDTLTSSCNPDSFFRESANPEWTESYYTALAAGEEKSFILPYSLWENEYGSKTWNNLENTDFYFRITVAPVAKRVVLNCNT